MKSLALLCLAALVAFAAANLDDELADLLHNLEDTVKMDKKTFTDNDDADDLSDVTDMENPCASHVCGWGKECVLGKDNLPVCECRHECPTFADPDPWDKVCSSQNETFPTLCHLYRQRCLCKRGESGCENNKYTTVHLEYLGQCKNLDTCTKDMMDQFSERMADWLFQVMKDLKQRQALHGEKWLEMLTEAQKDDTLRHVYPVIWKFCDLDKQPHDKAVTHHELIPITAPVIPMESCIKPFLENCDIDSDGGITLVEWGECLGVAQEDIIEQC